MVKIIIITGSLTNAETHLTNIISNIGTSICMRIFKNLPYLKQNQSVLLLANNENEIENFDMSQIEKTLTKINIKFEIPEFKFNDRIKQLNDAFTKQEKERNHYIREQMNYRSRTLSKQTMLKHR